MAASPPRTNWLNLLLAAAFVCGLSACGGGKAPQPAPAPTPTAPTGPGRTFHVSPSGNASGDGSAARPYDLATIVSASGPARGGDTIWLHGGTYRGAFASYLMGTADAPIVLR